MSNVRIFGETRIDERFGGDAAASGAAGWLGLAAAPTFALMALWTVFFNDQATMLCMAIPSSSPINGMTVMYLLMSFFHCGPWLKLLPRAKRTIDPSYVYTSLVATQADNGLPTNTHPTLGVADVRFRDAR
jgi:hypothetical protein